MSSEPDTPRESTDAESDQDDIARLSYELAQTNKRLSNLAERVDQLEYVQGQLVTDLPTSIRSKREKQHEILATIHEDTPSDAIAGSITRDKAAGVAGCSDRHARSLMRELSEVYDWVHTEQPGPKEQTRLLVDFPDGDHEAFGQLVDELYPEVNQDANR